MSFTELSLEESTEEGWNQLFHPSVRDLVALTLTKCGASVTVASSVEDALDLLASMTPDVIISDIAMRGMDGYAFVEKRRGRPGTTVPMIALTAYASVQDRERALALGFDSHLSKPVDPLVLVRTIAESRGPGPLGREAAGRSAA